MLGGPKDNEFRFVCLKTGRERYESRNNEEGDRKRWLERDKPRRRSRGIFNADCNAELSFEV